MAQPFIPRDKPKSFVVFSLSILTNLLVFGPMLFLAARFEIGILERVAFVGFTLAWVISAVTISVYLLRLLAGKYVNLTERNWTEQVW